MKAYLSGPMSNIPQFNIPAFAAAAKQLRSEGIEIVSPHELDEKDGFAESIKNSPDGNVEYFEFMSRRTYGEVLSRDVKALFEGGFDAIFVLDGWGQSKGARLEVFVALLLKIPVFSYEHRKELSKEYLLHIIQHTIMEGM